MNTKSIRRRALEASIYTLLGYGLSQGIRLANNIILTRLLVPEFFGIVAIGNVFITGIHLFSDIGLNTSVIRSNRSNDEAFINTIWTLQILRGFVITLISYLIAIPIAKYYNEPQLKGIIFAIGSFASIQGLFSLNLVLYSKELKQGILSVIEISGQLLGAIVGIIVAYYFRSVWALVVISFINTTFKLIAGYLLKSKIRPRFVLERETVNEVLTFGIWIFFSTAMTFLSGQIDKMLLGKMMAMTILGIFNIATTFSELMKQVLLQLSGKVLFPLFSKYKDLPRIQYRDKIRNPRLLILLLISFGVSVLTCFGDYVITFLYDERYYAAAWMLPILAVGIWPYVLYVSKDTTLYVLGKPKYIAFGNLAKFIYMILMVPIVNRYFGLFGIIIVIAFNDIPAYLFVNYGLGKEKLSFIRQDIISTAFMLLLIIFFLGIRFFLHLGIPGALYYS